MWLLLRWIAWWPFTLAVDIALSCSKKCCRMGSWLCHHAGHSSCDALWWRHPLAQLHHLTVTASHHGAEAERSAQCSAHVCGCVMKSRIFHLQVGNLISARENAGGIHFSWSCFVCVRNCLFPGTLVLPSCNFPHPHCSRWSPDNLIGWWARHFPWGH